MTLVGFRAIVFFFSNPTEVGNRERPSAGHCLVWLCYAAVLRQATLCYAVNC